MKVKGSPVIIRESATGRLGHVKAPSLGDVTVIQRDVYDRATERAGRFLTATPPTPQPRKVSGFASWIRRK